MVTLIHPDEQAPGDIARMATELSHSTHSTPQVPAELLEAVIAEARADADRVDSLLRNSGFVATPEAPFPLDRNFLLILGAYTRLAYWEKSGIQIHRDAGLPSASQVLAAAHEFIVERGTIPWADNFSKAVEVFFIERFAWHGRRDLDAAVVLDYFDEDSALDALAELLWARRLAECGGQ